MNTEVRKFEAPQGLPKNERKIGNEFQLQTLTSKEAAVILSKTEIHATKFLGKDLTVEILKKEGLAPRYKVAIENGPTCFLSVAYESDNGRVGVVAYVEKDGAIVARSYYRSNSQGIWRYLPSYQTRGTKINWYNKGYGEASITVPVVLQKTLAEISAREAPLRVTDSNFILAGTARNMAEAELETYRGEVNMMPQLLKGSSYKQEKVNPVNLELNLKQYPDFSKLVTSWNEQSSLYGPIVVEVFSSKDGQLTFMFCRDKSNRAWIGGIENTSEVGSTGVRRGWIDGGDITTPAYEYASMIENPEYANFEMTKKSYVDMFKNYLSKISIIKNYLLSRGITPAKEVSKIEEQKRNFGDAAVYEAEELQQMLISQAKTLDELFAILDKLPGKGISGSRKFYTIPMLKSIIQRFIEGKVEAMVITKTAGLRDKVLELVSQKKSDSGDRPTPTPFPEKKFN